MTGIFVPWGARFWCVRSFPRAGGGPDMLPHVFRLGLGPRLRGGTIKRGRPSQSKSVTSVGLRPPAELNACVI